MAQAMVSIRMDEELKRNMELVCREIGMSMTTAFTIFAKRMTRDHAIPFEVTGDPFYSESNMNYLRGCIREIESGNAKWVEKSMEELEAMENA